MEYGAVRTNFDYMATFGRLSVLENAPLTSHEPENDADSFIYIYMGYRSYCFGVKL